ncbi:monofunctional biosynthetic peptidoglycan transglycosylase [Pseudovibrio sp. SPO723]|uniref:monofunctional biosynthetic peptidoglycan transglycosylase n=1 Tax=Nesiotobacter zosterae TaxID=392721 RepID=UPI0029C2561A|nr:monofunctional biosynthetic peptidoglycan transglycosylase [Pseudovibrio sp. SPO723]MDX5594985.1 monofunctional biosynthetic peptidoglycan transglycosylase [Pseudovibrio sp. SPO723]
MTLTRSGSRSRRKKGRIKRFLLKVLAILLVTPVVLTVVYSVVPPVSTLMLGRYVTLQSVERDFVPLEEISVHLQRGVVISEDSLYCEHGGVDWAAMQTQVESLLEGERARGASTIPMQLAKNLFLWNSRSYLRKAVEAPLAIMLDSMLTKRRLLEVYLNTVEWGEGIFGAEAAAQHYFGVSAKDLSRQQAALMATTLPNPILRNPAKPNAGHRRLASVNQQRMKVAGDVLACTSAERQ